MKEYQLVCEHIWGRFNEEVTRLLNEGWELYGSPCTGIIGEKDNIDYTFIQAMVKNIKNTID